MDFSRNPQRKDGNDSFFVYISTTTRLIAILIEDSESAYSDCAKRVFRTTQKGAVEDLKSYTISEWEKQDDGFRANHASNDKEFKNRPPYTYNTQHIKKSR